MGPNPAVADREYSPDDALAGSSGREFPPRQFNAGLSYQRSMGVSTILDYVAYLLCTFPSLMSRLLAPVASLYL